MGWVGQGQHLLWWRILQSKIRNLAVAEKIGIRIFVKKCSNFVQKTPPILTFCEIVRNSLGAKRLGSIFQFR
jgi:hypothetical protein